MNQAQYSKVEAEFVETVHAARARLPALTKAINDTGASIDVETIIALLMIASYGYQKLHRLIDQGSIPGVDVRRVTFADVARLVDRVVVVAEPGGNVGPGADA